MQSAAQVTELEVPLHSRVAWLRRNYSYFEDEHKDVLVTKLDALTRTSGKKVCILSQPLHTAQYACTSGTACMYQWQIFDSSMIAACENAVSQQI